MCGIFGINERNDTLGNAATACIAHRGPDSHAVWYDEQVTLGFNRLAIIDLDPRANQPMWDMEKKIGIIFNGEIYNFKELKQDLESSFDFKTTSDTEVLIYGYKKYGPKFVERLNGMFAYAIYDTEKKKIFLFRDHAGIKPLVYYAKADVFVFASEMKAIALALLQKKIPFELDTDAIKTYYGLGYIPSPATTYANVKKLPRGSYLEFDLSSKSTSVEKYSAPSASPKTEKELFTIVESSTIEHLIADVPVGVFFSGGTDSSIIASVLHKRGVNLETFSIGVSGRDADRKYFKAISAHLGVHAHTYDFTEKEFSDVYGNVMKKTDEPNADISIFPTYFVSQKAAERVKVVLSGEGGDELFFGYGRQRALSSARNGSMKDELSFIEQLFLSTPTFKGKNYVFQRLFEVFRQPVSAYLLFMSPSRDLTDRASWQAAKKAVIASSADPLYFDRDLYLENALLRKTDFATSFNSIEGRVPLLDSRIVAVGPQFESMYLSSSESKPVLKRMLEQFLPKELVYRPKSGFGMSLPRVLPYCKELREDLDASIDYLKKRNLLFCRLPSRREELVERYPNLCFAMISLYRALSNNETSVSV